MPRKWWIKMGLFLIGTIFCILYCLPSIVPDGTLGPVEEVFKNRIKLGLDLQGGMHLVYSVKVDKAVIDKVERYGEDMEEELKKKKKNVKLVCRLLLEKKKRLSVAFMFLHIDVQAGTIKHV